MMARVKFDHGRKSELVMRSRPMHISEMGPSKELGLLGCVSVRKAWELS